MVEDEVDRVADSGEQSVDHAYGTPAAHACFGKKGDNDDAQSRQGDQLHFPHLRALAIDEGFSHGGEDGARVNHQGSKADGCLLNGDKVKEDAERDANAGDGGRSRELNVFPAQEVAGVEKEQQEESDGEASKGASLSAACGFLDEKAQSAHEDGGGHGSQKSMARGLVHGQ